jgi:hypothetical protein
LWETEKLTSKTVIEQESQKKGIPSTRKRPPVKKPAATDLRIADYLNPHT